MKWIGNFDMSLADITSVIAGTGLSGGGTTGAVTLNVDASIPEITTLAGLINIGTDGQSLNLFCDDMEWKNNSANVPEFNIYNTANDTTGPIISLANQRLDGGGTVQAGQDNDVLGTVRFRGYNDGGTPGVTVYALMQAQIDDATSGQESGKLSFYVANHDGGAGAGLILTGGSADNEVDITLGLGADSVVTVPGDIDLAGDIDVDGTLETDALTVGGTNILTGGIVTSVGKLTGPVEIEQGASGGGSALLIDNDDVDKVALEIDAANTTANVINMIAQDLTTRNAINVDCNSLTTGSAINLDIDDATTTNNTRSLVKIDYDKAGVAAAENTIATTGLDINMADAATNHADGIVTMIGAQIDVDSANAQGSINQKGLVLNVAADGVADTATTSGIEMEVVDGGTDIKMMSHADTGDYCSIATTTNGATTITTVDDNATAAHFEITADGDIILDSAGQIKLEPVAGNNILLDGTVTVDGGSVTGITTLGVDSVSLTAVQTSGESFVDNDTSVMTSAAIDDKILTKYANSIISFTGSVVMVSSGNWVMPGKSGISNHTWNKDISVNTETNGTSEATVPKAWAQSGVRVPFACIVDGISCILQNSGGNRQSTAGLFFARAADGTTAVDWGSGDNTEPILQIHADANNEGGAYTQKPAHAEVTGSDIAMAAGDVFYPAVKLTGVTSGGNTDTVYATFNVHIKTLLV